MLGDRKARSSGPLCEGCDNEGTSRDGRTRRITLFAVGAGTTAVDEDAATPFGDCLPLVLAVPFEVLVLERGASRALWSFGAILHSVFVVIKTASPLAGGSMLASERVRYDYVVKIIHILTHTKSNTRPSQYPDVDFLANFRYPNLRKQRILDMGRVYFLPNFVQEHTFRTAYGHIL